MEATDAGGVGSQAVLCAVTGRGWTAFSLACSGEPRQQHLFFTALLAHLPHLLYCSVCDEKPSSSPAGMLGLGVAGLVALNTVVFLLPMELKPHSLLR